MPVHTPSKIADLTFESATSHALGTPHASANERVVEMIQAAQPAVLAVLDVLGLGPFSRLSRSVVHAPDVPPSAPQADERFVDHDDDQALGADYDLSTDEAERLNAELSDPWADSPIETSGKPTTLARADWGMPWNDTLVIDQRQNLNVWGSALVGPDPDRSLTLLRPWVSKRLATCGDHARTHAVQALLDDRWGFSQVLCHGDANALRAAWHHVVQVLEDAQGPWPLLPEPMVRFDGAESDTDRAKAWVMGSMLYRLMQDGDPLVWAVPVLTELGGGPQVWTESLWPVNAWRGAEASWSHYRLPPVAIALAGFCFNLAEAMIQTGIDPEQVVLDALPVDEAHWDDDGNPTGPEALAPTVMGLAWGAWQAVGISVDNPALWWRPLPGLGAIAALMHAGANLDTPLLRQPKPKLTMEPARKTSAAFDPFADLSHHEANHQKPQDPRSSGVPRLVKETVEQSMTTWLATVPEASYDTVGGAMVRKMLQHLESLALQRVAAEFSLDSKPRPRL